LQAFPSQRHGAVVADDAQSNFTRQTYRNTANDCSTFGVRLLRNVRHRRPTGRLCSALLSSCPGLVPWAFAGHTQSTGLFVSGIAPPDRAAPDLLLDFASLLTSDPGDAPQNANRAKPKRLGAICLPAWSGRGWRRSWEHHLLRLGAVGLAALSAACRLPDLLGRNGSLAYTLLLCQCHFESLELKGQGYMWRGRPVFDTVPVSRTGGRVEPMRPAGCCLHPCTEPPGRSWRNTGLQARKLPLLFVANHCVRPA
jgi:hypothetical protein